jgi:hypothetical protein
MILGGGGIMRATYHAPAVAGLTIGCLAILVSALQAQEPKATPGSEVREEPGNAADKLAMTKAVACRSIDGFEQYEVLPNAELTAEEKLQIYYRPLHCKFAVKGEEYLIHLRQDGQIRRKGEKLVLRRKKNILDYEAKTRQPPDWIFLRNSVPLKGLPPGEYEYDIILRDENNPGPPAVQSLPFRIIPPTLPTAKRETN